MLKSYEPLVLSEIPELNFEDSISAEEMPKYVRNIYTPVSASAEFSLECEINAPFFEKLCGYPRSGAESYTLTCKVPYQKQIRRHKKKRINKKWAKRYGYKTMFNDVTLEDVQFANGDGEIDILGRMKR